MYMYVPVDKLKCINVLTGFCFRNQVVLNWSSFLPLYFTFKDGNKITFCLYIIVYMYVQYVFWLVRQVVYPVSLLTEFSQYIMVGLRILASKNNKVHLWLRQEINRKRLIIIHSSPAGENKVKHAGSQQNSRKQSVKLTLESLLCIHLHSTCTYYLIDKIMQSTSETYRCPTTAWLLGGIHQPLAVDCPSRWWVKHLISLWPSDPSIRLEVSNKFLTLKHKVFSWIKGLEGSRMLQYQQNLLSWLPEF